MDKYLLTDEEDLKREEPEDGPMTTYLFCRQLEKGEIWVNEVITNDTINKLCMNLNYLNEKDEIDIIKIYINSRGGALFPSLACVDFIRTIPKPVTTIVTGVAFSGAFFLSMAGDYRTAYPFSSFMIHDQVIEYAGGYRGSLHRELTFQDNMNSKMATFLSERCGLGFNECRKWINEEYDTYMDSEVALSKGVIHEIIKPKLLTLSARDIKKINEIKKSNATKNAKKKGA